MKTGNITKPLIAGGGAGIIDTFLLPYLTGFGLSTPIARMVAGTAGQYVIKRKGMLKNMFIAEATVGAFDLGKSLVGGMSGTATTSGKLF
jgi:hypothetical protein